MDVDVKIEIGLAISSAPLLHGVTIVADLSIIQPFPYLGG
jgi:hypothetical protein